MGEFENKSMMAGVGRFRFASFAPDAPVLAVLFAP
jgi:hypothetical protein